MEKEQPVPKKQPDATDPAIQKQAQQILRDLPLDERRRPELTDPQIQAQIQERLRNMPISEIIARRRRPQAALSNQDDKREV